VKTKINKARFPFLKTLEEFDFNFQPALNQKEVSKLSSLEFLDNKENLLFLGPPGVGNYRKYLFMERFSENFHKHRKSLPKIFP